MAAKKRYKFLRLDGKTIKSQSGDHSWEIGEWYTQDEDPKLCKKGYHCSKKITQAFSYVQGEVFAVVEVKGSCDIESDKEAYQSMKIVKAYKWTKTDSVALAIYAAELVIDIFEKYAPNDKRPREAIEAAKRYLENQNKKNQDAAADAAARAADAANAAKYAAYAADAANAAYAADAADAANAAKYAADAANAADAATYATYAAKYAADAANAADAATYATYAADAARAAAYAAADAALTAKIEKWLVEHVKSLEEL